MSPRSFLLAPALCALLAPAFAGCDAAGGSGADSTTLSFQLDGGSSLLPGTAGALAGGANVALTEVKLLVNAIHFNAGSGDDDSTGTEVEFEDANLVVNLPLDGSPTAVAVADVPPGTYTRVKFKIHKPEDAEAIPDEDFRDGPSGNERYSVIVRGTVDGEAFELKVRESIQQRLTLSPPLVVGDGGSADVTLLADVSGWFVSDGGAPLDPRDEDDADEIADRIDDSFRALGR
jgi:hypothetical protein